MSNEVRFENNTMAVMNAIDNAVNAWLEEAAGEVESQTKRNTPVGKFAGGNTKQNWQHVVDESNHEAVIGNPLETAIWVEMGTGDYAVNGDGRRGGWYIPIGDAPGQISQSVVDAYGFKVVYGKNKMKYAFTTGMKPKRPLQKAYDSKKNKIQKALDAKLKSMGG